MKASSSVTMLRVATAVTALMALYPTQFQTRVHAQEQQQEEAAEQLDDEVRPAPPSTGADVPLVYFGPAPSSVDKRLVGPVQLLLAGVIDEALATIQLPLYAGYYKDGSSHYYVLTPRPSGSTIRPSSRSRAVGPPILPAFDFEGAVLVDRMGKVDFSPENSVIAADEPAPFPPPRGLR